MAKTKREYFAELKTIVADNADLVAFIDHEVELLNKKNSAPKNPTAKQIENDGFKSDIVAWMANDATYTAGDVLKGVPSVVASGMSVNRVSALLTQLVNDGTLTKSVDKRKNYYSLA